MFPTPIILDRQQPNALMPQRRYTVQKLIPSLLGRQPLHHYPSPTIPNHGGKGRLRAVGLDEVSPGGDIFVDHKRPVDSAGRHDGFQECGVIRSRSLQKESLHPRNIRRIRRQQPLPNGHLGNRPKVKATKDYIELDSQRQGRKIKVASQQSPISLPPNHTRL